MSKESSITKEGIIMKIMIAPAGTLEKVAAILDGKADSKLLTITEAAKTLGVSAKTVTRMLDDKRLASVETRAGRRRIPSSEITKLLSITQLLDSAE